MYKKFCVIIGLIFFVHFAGAQNNILDVGIRLQQTVNLYNENGFSINYSIKNLKPDRLYFGFTYVTSRLGTAFHSNAIKQDNFLISGAWYLRRKHIIRPFGRLNTGYFSAEYGSKIFDVLPRKSVLLSTEAGVCFETNLPLKISSTLGYNFITGNGLSGPGTLYPLFYQLTVSWNVLNKGPVHQAGRKQI